MHDGHAEVAFDHTVVRRIQVNPGAPWLHDPVHFSRRGVEIGHVLEHLMRDQDVEEGGRIVGCIVRPDEFHDLAVLEAKVVEQALTAVDHGAERSLRRKR